MLKVIIWIILIYFVLLLFWRYVVPYLVRRFFRKLEKRMTREFRDSEGPEPRRYGEVIIEDAAEKPEDGPPPVNEDEYVDFEEIIGDDDEKG